MSRGCYEETASVEFKLNSAEQQLSVFGEHELQPLKVGHVGRDG